MAPSSSFILPKNVVFYVEEDKFELKAKNTNITASIYVPTNKIYLSGNGPCIMTGRFIAYYIDDHAKNVTWNSYDCIPHPAAPGNALSNTETELITKMEMQAYPNPTNNYFNLKLKTDGKEDVMIRIISVTGKVMQELKGAPYQIFRVGIGLLPGIYIAEMRQGNEMVMLKLVKQ